MSLKSLLFLSALTTLVSSVILQPFELLARETTQEEFFALVDPSKRPVVAFLEVRSIKGDKVGLPLHLSADHKSPIATHLPPGTILKLHLDMINYSERERDVSQDRGRWRRVPVFNGDELDQYLYFYDHWSRVSFVYDMDWKLPLQPTKNSPEPVEFFSRAEIASVKADCKREDTYCIPSNEIPDNLTLLETRLVRNDHSKSPHLYYQVELPYSFKEGERETTGAWINSLKATREHSYSQIMQNSCVSLNDLYYDKDTFKQVLLDLHLLEKNKQIRQRIDIKLLSLAGSDGNRNKFKRWIKTKEIKLGGTDADITLIREVVDIRTEIGGAVGYESINIDHKTDLSEISYVATGVNAALYAYVPIFFDMDLVFKAGITAPTEQTYTDEIKQRELEVDSVYFVRGEQQFLYSFPTPNPTLSYEAGFGLSYKAMISNQLSFGFDSVVGASLTGAVNYGRFSARIRFEPIANQFQVNFDSYEISSDLGYRIIDNEFEKDWILFLRAASNRVLDGDSDMQSLYFVAGLSLGF